MSNERIKNGNRPDTQRRLQVWFARPASPTAEELCRLVDELDALGRQLDDKNDQLRHLQRQLKASLKRFHRLVVHIPVGVFRTMPNGHFISGNPAMAHMLGLSSERDLQGASALGFYLDPSVRKELIQRLDREGVVTDFEAQFKRQDGSVFWGAVSAGVVRDPTGRPLHYDGIIEDITYRKEIERLRERQRERLEEMVMERTIQLNEAYARLQKSAQELRERNRQIEDDLELAREVQEALLTHHHPTFPPSAAPGRSALRFHHVYVPAGEVGGDFFDIIPVSETEAGVFIYDVMGHGLRSALVTGIVRGLVEELGHEVTDPGRFLAHLNRKLRAIFSQPEHLIYATAVYAVFDSVTGQVRYANAAHPHPVWLRKQRGTVTRLRQNGTRPGPALGLFDRTHYPTAKAQLAKDDELILFTDGLCEACNQRREEYGERRLLRSIRRNAALPPDLLPAEVVSDVRRFTGRLDFQDDLCLVAVQVERILGETADSQVDGRQDD